GLDVVLLAALRLHWLAEAEHLFPAPRRAFAALHARGRAPAAATCLAITALGDFRPFLPHRVPPRRLQHELLPALITAFQDAWLAAVAFVRRDAREHQAFGRAAIEQLQRDLPLGPIQHVVRDAGLAATLAIVAPRLRQKQFAVEQAVEVL